jgi:hypothetical protein
LSAVIVAALGLIVWGFASAQTGDQAVHFSDRAIERVLPNPGELVLRQSQVGIDLAPGYRGLLVIDGQEIPTYDAQAPGAATPQAVVNFDAQFDPALNTVLFSPKQGATIEEFAPGDHRITAIYWEMSKTRDDARSFSWSFKVS